MIGASHASILCQRAKDLFPGVAVAILVAVAAKFLSEHYTAPAMLMALLLGIAVSFLAEEGKTIAGINFSARALLRLGVALLGARISFDLITALGAPMIALVVGGLVATILFGLAVGRLFGAKWRFSFLTAGSVAICGASAAMAIAAILPKDERSLTIRVASATRAWSNRNPKQKAKNLKGSSSKRLPRTRRAEPGSPNVS